MFASSTHTQSPTTCRIPSNPEPSLNACSWVGSGRSKTQPDRTDATRIPTPIGAPLRWRSTQGRVRSMTEPAAGDPTETLQLADWRRRVADLYAEVRRLAGTDREGALDLWRATREQLYREHPQSPVPATKRDEFRAHHYPV